MNDEQMLSMATEFAVTPHDPYGGPDVRIAFRGLNIFGVRVKGVPKAGQLWCVSYSGCVLNRKGAWEYEPMPSSRSYAFMARTRYSRDDAFAAWQQYAAGNEFSNGGWRKKSE